MATSGDTGSAVLDGFRRHAGTCKLHQPINPDNHIEVLLLLYTLYIGICISPLTKVFCFTEGSMVGLIVFFPKADACLPNTVFCFTEGSGVGVIVLFPEHGISEVQRLQMTAMSGGNVQVLGELSTGVE